ncbi:hypothetical protein D9M68_945890 [compost metagenome]
MTLPPLITLCGAIAPLLQVVKPGHGIDRDRRRIGWGMGKRGVAVLAAHCSREISSGCKLRRLCTTVTSHGHYRRLVLLHTLDEGDVFAQ